MSDEPKTVRVRVAVVIDSDGAYVATGSSGFSLNETHALVEHALDAYEQEVGNNRLQHVKFLEIALPLPDTRPINLEARPPDDERPATILTSGPVLREGDS